MKTYQVNKKVIWRICGAYIPEILHRCVEELKKCLFQSIGK